MQAVVIGAGGAIGRALVARLAGDERYGAVHALSRSDQRFDGDRVRTGHIDIGDDASIAAAAARIPGPLDLVLIATGLLHADGHRPERALRELDPDRLARSFAVNTIGPALVLRHFAPLLPRSGRAVVGALSARVGSIADNRAGGWYGYRASKAALNMVVRCAAIELARTRPDVVCVTLHPGTVDSSLSRPFQGAVPADRLFTPDHAAACLLDVVEHLAAADSGGCFAWDGTPIPF